MNTARVAPQGTYYEENFKLIDISEPKENKNGRSEQYQSFRIEKELSYTDSAGNLVEMPALHWFCNTFRPEVIQLLSTLQVGDRVNVNGYIQSSYKGWKYTGDMEGYHFIIPKPGKPDRFRINSFCPFNENGTDGDFRSDTAEQRKGSPV